MQEEKKKERGFFSFPVYHVNQLVSLQRERERERERRGSMWTRGEKKGTELEREERKNPDESVFAPWQKEARSTRYIYIGMCRILYATSCYLYTCVCVLLS